MTISDRNPDWPTPGDKLFQDRKSEESFHLDSIRCLGSTHAKAFVLAAEKIIETHYKGIHRLGYDDYLFFPVVYLYRHAMEIELERLS